MTTLANNERYTPLARIATGGQAEILLALHQGAANFKKIVVIKRLLPHLADDQESKRRLEREATLVARLHHPNVCQVLDLFDGEGGPLIVFEFLDGVTMSQVATGLPEVRTTENVRMIAGIIEQACEGLHSAHELKTQDGRLANLVHRDVSSNNIIVTREGIAKVLDFGIARAPNLEYTHVTSIMGTLAFMSPEQIRRQELDRRSDIFSLAVVAFEALTGRALFRRAQTAETFDAIASASVPRFHDRQPSVPEELERCLRKALAADREQRFATAKQFGEAIADAVRSIGGTMRSSEIAEVIRRDHNVTLDASQRRVDGLATGGLSSPTVRLTDAYSAERTIPTVELRPTDDLAAEVETVSTPVSERASPRRRTGWIVAVIATLAFVVSTLAWLSARRDQSPLPVVGSSHPVALAPPLVDAALEPPSTGSATSVPPAVESTVTPRAATRSKRAAVRPEPTSPGFLTIDSRPAAAILIDGKPVGQVPLFRIPVTPGKHTITATTEDGRSKRMTIAIGSGDDVRKRITW